MLLLLIEQLDVSVNRELLIIIFVVVRRLIGSRMDLRGGVSLENDILGGLVNGFNLNQINPFQVDLNQEVRHPL